MKKNIFKFILLLLVIFSYSPVFAASDNNHIYFVESLKFEGEKINIKGYAFVSHMDNYGKDGNIGNLSNYLVAYTGNDVSLNSSGKCTSDGGNCVVIPLTNANNDYDVDLFWSRCEKASGGGGAGDCTKENYVRYEEVEDGRLNFAVESASSCEGKCMYHNVGFNTSVVLKNLVKDLNNGSEKLTSEIKFKIYSKIIDAGTAKIYDSKFGVSKIACTIGKNPCMNDTEFSIANGLYKMKIDGSSNMFEFDAVEAAAQTKKDGGFEKYWNNESDYRFYNTKYGDSIEKYTYKIEAREYNERKVFDGTAMDFFYKLDAFETKSDYIGTSSKLIVPNYDGVDREYTGIKSENIWAFANWGQVANEFRITGFEPQYMELKCENLKSYLGENMKDGDVNCNENPKASFYSCQKLDSPITTQIYLKLDDKQPDCGEGQYEESNGEYYLPVNVSSKVLLEQSGTFNFDKFTPGTVRAGKGFSINSNGIWYENKFKWYFASIIAETSDANYKGTPYIDYSGYLPVKVNDECKADYDYVNKKLNDEFKENAKSERIFYKSSDGEFVNAGSTLDSVVRSFDIYISKEYYNTSKIDEVIFNSCDSNSKTSSCHDRRIETGFWEVSSENDPIYIRGKKGGESIFNNIVAADRGFGMERKIKFNYQLPNAYVALSNSKVKGISYKSGDIVYSKNKLSSGDLEEGNLKYVGNKYFVGFKQVLKYGDKFDFPYYLENNSNISFVDGMNDWSIEGMCGVSVKSGYYKKNTPKCPNGSCNSDEGVELAYNFRPISLSSPFPKKSIATNWEEWTKINTTNMDRLERTIDNGVKYRIRLSKFKVDGAVKISDINSLQIGSYDELNGYNIYGTSSFVTDYFKELRQDQDSNSYCKLGYFSVDCDVIDKNS